MSDKTLNVMKKHLHIAEEYIAEMQNADSKKGFLAAIGKCTESVKGQYPELEEIADDYCRRITENDKELKEISGRIGDIYSGGITKLYVKMGPYMADPEFMEALSGIDIVIGNNPLFGTNEFGAEIATEVARTIAGSMDGIATQIIADTTESDSGTVSEITGIMTDFLDLSKRYVAKIESASTSRKIVTATDSFVDAIKKMVPGMKKNADQLKLIMARKDRPEQIIAMSAELKKVLGDDLKAVMKDKHDLLSEIKVQKAVAKLGAVLNSVPF